MAINIKKDSGNYESMKIARKKELEDLGLKPKTNKDYQRWRAKQKRDFPLW